MKVTSRQLTIEKSPPPGPIPASDLLPVDVFKPSSDPNRPPNPEEERNPKVWVPILFVGLLGGAAILGAALAPPALPGSPGQEACQAWPDPKVDLTPLERKSNLLYLLQANNGDPLPDSAARKVALENLTMAMEPQLWDQIERVDQVWNSGLIELRVKNVDRFEQALRGQGYGVNVWWDQIPGISTHPNLSARQSTRRADQPGLHFANDQSERPQTFWVHFDARSVNFTQAPQKCLPVTSTWAERIRSGRTHKLPFTPCQAREALRRSQS